MITENSQGQPISQAFVEAVSQPFVGYRVHLMDAGAEIGSTIKRLTLELGAGISLDSNTGGFSFGRVLASQLTATLFGDADLTGKELEVRVGVEVSEGTYEYVTVAWVTVTSCKVWKGVQDVRACGRAASKTSALLGLDSGDYAPSAIATQIGTSAGVSVSLGAFQNTDTLVHVNGNETCREALALLAFRLGGFAAESGAGILVSPFSSAQTFSQGMDKVTKRPELGEAYILDGLKVDAASGTYSFGTGKVEVSDATATADTAATLWANLQGYSYTPAEVTVSCIDPRVTVFDTMGLTVGGATYSVPCWGIAATYDGGYFGTYTAQGISAIAQEVQVEGPMGAKVGAAVKAAAEAQAVADAVNQHFWFRSADPDGDGAGTGAFVTDEEQDVFLGESPTFPDKSSERPFNNLLMNSNGILLRSGLTNSAAFTPSSVSFFDGQGNDAANVTAMFGADGAQIGRAEDRHIVLSANGLGVKDSNSRTAALFGQDQVLGYPDVETVIDDDVPTTYYGTGCITVRNGTMTFTSDAVTLDRVPTEAIKVGKGATSPYGTLGLDVGFATVAAMESHIMASTPVLYLGPRTVSGGFASVPWSIDSNGTSLDFHFGSNNRYEPSDARWAYGIAEKVLSIGSDGSITSSGEIEDGSGNSLSAVNQSVTGLGLQVSGIRADISDLQADMAGKADLSDLAAYLPLTGGTLTGPITVTEVNGLTDSDIPDLPAGKITSGAFDAARIPGLDAGKITSGTFAAARIPTLDIGTKTSGTLGIDRGGTGATTAAAAWTALGGGDLGKKDSLTASDIPSLAAGKITSGTFDAARIPSLDASKIGSGTLDAARIPSLDYLPLSGGTMTGAVGRSTSLSLGTAGNVNAVEVFDSGGVRIGQLRVGVTADSKSYAYLVARQGTSATGGIKSAALGISCDSSGNATYTVTTPKAFCEAINVGTTYSASKNMTIGTAGIDTWTDGASVSLPAGTYIVVGEWIFNSGAGSGNRNNQVGIRSGSTTHAAQRVLYPNQAYARLQATAVITLDATTTVNVSGSSSSTYTSATATSIKAVRIC